MLINVRVNVGFAVPVLALFRSSNTGTFTVGTPGWKRQKLVSINHLSETMEIFYSVNAPD